MTPPTQPPAHPNFDRVARIYRWAEYLTLGPLLMRIRTHFLPQLNIRTRALVLGDGDGRFLVQLLHQQPHLQALAVDTSATMLQLLRNRCQPYGNRLQTLQTSALQIFDSPEASAPIILSQPQLSRSGTNRYPEPLGSGLISPAEEIVALAPNLIVTHFFLDCLTQAELDTLAHNLAATTKPGTLWLLSDFAIPRAPLLKPLATLYIRALYLAFRILTGLRVTHLPNPQASLQNAGFTRINRHELLHGLLYTELWQHQ